MVSIPEYSDATLDAMKAAVEEAAAKEPARTYLGASSIGESCSRKIWYKFNQYPSEPRKFSLIAAAEDGHRTEALVAARLRLVPGIKLWTEDEHGKQFGFMNGQFGGHLDGVILGLRQAPKTPHVWESKACNPKIYAQFQKAKFTYGEKMALRQWSFPYWAQGQIYMRYFDLTRHYLTVSTPGGRDIDSCRTEYDPVAAEGLVTKAKRIIAAKEPPERIGGPTWHECKWCDFYMICHGASSIP